MLDQEPLWYPSRGPFNPGVPNRQLWAIGMIVVQWGMAEFIREQSTFSLMGDDSKLIEEYRRLRNSEQKTNFWKTLVETKMQEPERTKNFEFVTRFEALKNQRDDIIHRLWGGGMETGTLGAPDNATTTDAALHRNRSEKMKTKSKDARANLRWRLTFTGLRDIAQNIAQLNHDILMSWVPPGSPPGMHHIWAFLDAEGKLQVGISSPSESEPHIGD
jgi:hypothetical protein